MSSLDITLVHKETTGTKKATAPIKYELQRLPKYTCDGAYKEETKKPWFFQRLGSAFKIDTLPDPRGSLLTQALQRPECLEARIADSSDLTCAL